MSKGKAKALSSAGQSLWHHHPGRRTPGRQARRFVATLWGEGGRRLLERRGFHPASPFGAVPAPASDELSSLVVQKP